MYIHATFKVIPPETTTYRYLCLNSCINFVYRPAIRGGLSLVPFLCYFVLKQLTWKHVTWAVGLSLQLRHLNKKRVI